jgi:hypothetical protein
VLPELIAPKNRMTSIANSGAPKRGGSLDNRAADGDNIDGGSTKYLRKMPRVRNKKKYAAQPCHTYNIIPSYYDERNMCLFVLSSANTYSINTIHGLDNALHCLGC